MSKRLRPYRSPRRAKGFQGARIPQSVHRRVRRISFRDNWTTDMTVILILFLLAAFWIIPWLSGLVD
jgi:hypothetical protein